MRSSFLNPMRNSALAIFGAALLVMALGLALAPQAEAHVKWFAPYIVQAQPQSVLVTLADPWFWLGIFLVTLFLLLSRFVERLPLGDTVMDAMDRISDPLWNRLDDFVRAMIAAFFIAISAVGGVYLTPDLKTPSEWVSWTQLLIAAGIFS